MNCRAGAPVLTAVALVTAGELLSRSGVLGHHAFPPVTAVLASLWGALSTRVLWVAVGQTLTGWALGLAIAMALAVPIGVAVGSSWTIFRSSRVVIEFLRPIPSVALVPLAILTSGTGLRSTVFLATFAGFWILLVQTVYGVQQVDPVAEDTARVFGLSAPARLVHVTIPSAMPYLATGTRMASSVALVVTVTAEMVVGSPGLGHSISLARSSTDVALMYALIVVTGALGWALNAQFARLERRILHWHASQGAA